MRCKLNLCQKRHNGACKLLSTPRVHASQGCTPYGEQLRNRQQERAHETGNTSAMRRRATLPPKFVRKVRTQSTTVPPTTAAAGNGAAASKAAGARARGAAGARATGAMAQEPPTRRTRDCNVATMLSRPPSSPAHHERQQ